MAVIFTALINYHLIYIGCPVDRHLIYDVWTHGNIDVRPINSARIRYVLDYINKDPIFPDSKYEMYGDFEPPFYHFSKGIGFEEIMKMHEQGQFDSLGKTEFNSSGHTYTLNPYLKDKLGYVSKTTMYPDSVIDWANEKKLDNLDKALENRSKVIETSNNHKVIQAGKPFINLQKKEIQEINDRQNRFNGFTDYDKIDKIISNMT